MYRYKNLDAWYHTVGFSGLEMSGVKSEKDWKTLVDQKLSAAQSYLTLWYEQSLRSEGAERK